MVFQVPSQRCRGGEWLGQYYIGGTEGVHAEHDDTTPKVFY